MFGALPPAAAAMEMDSNGLPIPGDEVEFEANWKMMNEILRELELESLQAIPDEQPEYVPSIEEFNRTQCPMCSNESLYQFSSQHPIACRHCSFQYQARTGSLNEIHAYHRQTMPHCPETKLHSTLWNNDDGTMPSLLLLCIKCDFNFCL